MPPPRGSLASLSIAASRVFLFGVLPLMLAATHVWLDERVGHRAQRLEVFMLYMLAVGFGTATAAVVGQNLGAGQVERARRAAWVSASRASTSAETSADRT